MDQSRPMPLEVKTQSDHVELRLGPLVVGLDPATARRLAESLLAAVGDLDGKDYILLAAGYTFSTHESRGWRRWPDDDEHRTPP